MLELLSETCYYFVTLHCTKKEVSIKDFLSKCDQMTLSRHFDVTLIYQFWENSSGKGRKTAESGKYI